jgi:hypothetical protein
MTRAEKLLTLLAIQDSYVHQFGENPFTPAEQDFFRGELHRLIPEVTESNESLQELMHELIQEKLEDYRNGN